MMNKSRLDIYHLIAQNDANNIHKSCNSKIKIKNVSNDI